MSETFDLTGSPSDGQTEDTRTSDSSTVDTAGVAAEPTDKVAPKLNENQRKLTGPGGPLNETQFIDESVEAGEGQVKDKEFVYTTHLDPNRLLPRTSPYLDDVEREKAEITRAKIEDREPDLDNAPAAQGTPLVSLEYVKRSTGVNYDHVPVTTLPVVVSE